MTACRLILRSLAYFRAAHAALLAGMILVTAVLTGALILGDSVRDSLADLTRRRHGGYELIVTAPAFFSQSLAQRTSALSGRACDAGLTMPGRARSERTTLSAGAQLLAISSAAAVPMHSAWITRALAESLDVTSGDALLITLPSEAGSSDAVLARRDRSGAVASLRVAVARILDDRAMQQPEAFLAWFDLHPSQRPPASLWLNIADLQDALQADVPPASRIPQSPANILLAGPVAKSFAAALDSSPVPPPQAMTLEDYGLGFMRSNDRAILQSGGIYISPQLATALHPLATAGLEVYTLLLDQVATDDAQIPPLNYVMAAGISGHDDMGLGDDQAAVNQWMADQLHVKLGDTLHVTPYRASSDGTVAVAQQQTVKVARIVPMEGLGADSTLAPTFHGLTDADTIAQWNPPAGFPFDRSRVTPADETYWNVYKAAPKIFFNLGTAQRLMPQAPAASAGRLGGELTSVRLPAAQADEFERKLLRILTPQSAGFATRPLAPDQPDNTDFASLFLGLSGFLLIAALLLVVLLFRLAVEQRSRQLGLLGALGFTPGRVGRIILAEGALVAVLGAIVGLPAAVLYTRWLVDGLGTWWIGATGTQAITLHIHSQTLAIGSAASLLAAILALAVTAWRLARLTPIAQLQGTIASPPPKSQISNIKFRSTSLAFAGLFMALSPVVLSWAGYLAAPTAFMLSGFLMLAFSIAVLAKLPAASRRVRQTLVAVAAAGILRQRTRSVLCVALMAAATFLLTSVTAFESEPTEPTKPPSSTGGYQLMITTQIPLPADLQTPAGRKLLGVPEDPLFAATCFTSLRVKAGDDISCLNMTRPTSATLVGVPPDVLQRLAVTAHGPRTLAADGIPAAVDEQTAQYILHTGIGDRLPESATTRPIVVDSLLADSIFQSYALIPEADFRQAFPAVTRCSLILVDCPPPSVPALRDILRRSLDDFGVTVETTTGRLAAYHAVADSYIAAFQFLGALALAVGALGLVVVLARNVIQRRSELALLAALGFTRGRVTLMLVIEHGLLLLLGLALGVATALLAMAGQIRQVHIAPVAGAIGIILALGLLVLAAAAQLAMRRLSPAALRQE
jgi:ABC-type lipoprotein release transport system permease subunit